VKSTIVRIIASAFAGFITYFAIGTLIALTSNPWSISEKYFYVFGLSDRIAHLFDWPHYSNEDEFYGPHGRAIAIGVTIGFWTVLFGTLYFRYVFRRKGAHVSN
jgi:hypothetical protein